MQFCIFIHILPEVSWNIHYETSVGCIKILFHRPCCNALTITACTAFLAHKIPTSRRRICGCHTGVDEGSSHIVCDAVSISKLLPTFRRSLLPPCPGLKQSKKCLLVSYIDALFMHFILFVHTLWLYHLHTQTNAHNLYKISNVNGHAARVIAPQGIIAMNQCAMNIML